MGKRKPKKPKPTIADTCPASMGLADAPNDFAAANAVEAGQITRTTVYRRRDRLDDLLARKVIDADGWRILNDYRSTYERGGFDRMRSCLDNSIGHSDGMSIAIISAQRSFAAMRGRVPAIYINTLDAVAIEGRTLEAIASDRQPMRSRPARYVMGRTNRATNGSLAIVREELLRAIEALMIRRAKAA